jgi:hypothetical protein
MRADRRCQDFSDLSAKERRQCWAIAAIAVVALFGLTIADALLM